MNARPSRRLISRPDDADPDSVQLALFAKVCAAATAISLPVGIAGIAEQDKLVQGLSSVLPSKARFR